MEEARGLLARAECKARETKLAASCAAKETAGRFQAFRILRNEVELQQQEVCSAKARVHQAHEKVLSATTRLNNVTEDGATAWKNCTRKPKAVSDDGVLTWSARWVLSLDMVRIGKRLDREASLAKDAAENHARSSAELLAAISTLANQASCAFEEAYLAEYAAVMKAEQAAAMEVEQAAATETAEQAAATEAERESKRVKPDSVFNKTEVSRLNTLWAVTNVYDELLGDDFPTQVIDLGGLVVQQ